MKKLKLGVVGLGMGRHHAGQYHRHPQCDLVALCDMNEELLQQQARELNVEQTYADAETMFKKAGLDAVSIATPNAFHAPLSIAALQAGLHVLCEKPMAMTVKESEDMAAAARETGKNLMINFSFRYMPASQAIKQLVDSGALGNIYFGRTVWHRRRGMPKLGGWFSNKKMSGGGPLIDLGVHRLDLALWLMGYPKPVSVSGSVYNQIARQVAAEKNAHYDVEDLACGLIKFDNGATLILEASWALNIKEREHIRTTLCGTKGGVFQTNLEEGYRFSSELYTMENGEFINTPLDNVDYQGPSSCGEFINSILENRSPDATPQQGIKVMKILEGIYRSAELGREIRYNNGEGKVLTPEPETAIV